MEQLKQEHLLNQHQQHLQQQQQQQHLIHLQQQQQQQQHVDSMFTNQNRHAYHSNEHTNQLVESNHIHILNHPGTELTNNLSYNPSQQMEPHNEYFTTANTGIDNSKPLGSRLLNQLEIKRNIDDYSEIGTDDQDESSSCSSSSSTSNSSYNVSSIKNANELISIKANFEADSSPATNTLTPIDTNQTSDSKESVANIKVEIQCKDVMDVEDIKCVNKNFEAANLLSSGDNHVTLEDDTGLMPIPESADNHTANNEMANVYRKFKISANSMSSSEVNAEGFLVVEESPKLVDKVKAENNQLEDTIQTHLDTSSQSS